MSLKLDWCSYDAAKFAVLNWHYSKAMPSGKLTRIGVWEDGRFIGAVLFGRGANNNLAKSFGLDQTECCELVRVALTHHNAPVTQIVAIALKMLHKLSPGLKMVASYADWTNQNHLGIIYRAGNWIYLGSRKSEGAAYYIINGKKMHGRSVRAKWGSEKRIPYPWRYADPQVKLLYAYAFDATMKQKLEGMRQKHSSDAADFQLAEGGVEPTLTHQ